MKLFSLDKKLITLQHRFTHTELQQLMLQHKLTETDMTKEIQHQLYSKFIAGAASILPTSVITDVETKTYTVRGFVLSERDMNNLILEVLELVESDRINMTTQIKKQLGITQ